MAVSDPKQVAAMLVDGMHKDSAPSDEASGDGQEDSQALDPGEEQAGEEMMQALQSNDVQGFVSALKSFLQLV